MFTKLPGSIELCIHQLPSDFGTKRSFDEGTNVMSATKSKQIFLFVFLICFRFHEIEIFLKYW